MGDYRKDKDYADGVRDGQNDDGMQQFAATFTNPYQSDEYRKGYEYGASHRPKSNLFDPPSRPKGLSGPSDNPGNGNTPSSSSSDEDAAVNIIGWLIAVGLIVFVVIWLAVNIVLPIALLNSALALTILGLLDSRRKRFFASLAIVGGIYMFLDIINGWFSANFVNNVVKDTTWISAFVYINSGAIGLSTYFLVSPNSINEKGLSNSYKQKNTDLNGISIFIVLIATLTIPILYNTIHNQFTEKITWIKRNSENSQSNYQQSVTSYETMPSQTTTIETLESNNISHYTHSYNGNVGELTAQFSLTWFTDGSIRGVYYFPKRQNEIITLKGIDYNNGKIKLLEYNGEDISAYCELIEQSGCYVGIMTKIDGREFNMTICDISTTSINGKFPQASFQILTSNDLEKLNRTELKIMRNEIFARHGYVFKSAEMINYFNNQEWYTRIPKLKENDDVLKWLTAIEKKNIKLISSYE